MVYAHLFNNKDHMVGFGKRYYVVSSGNRSLDNFLIVIHEKILTHGPQGRCARRFGL